MVIEISGGDNDFVRKMVQLFLDTMPACLSELQLQTQQQSWEQVGKLAHKLKSTIDSMGIASLKKDIRIIENNGRKLENIKAIPALVARVVEVMEECMERIKKDFNI
jgi:HPt (histidine-containing phosphotransfer) domain-containing protein